MSALGTYHARSCTDAASLDRDGAEFYDFATLTSRAGAPVAEVQFADGQWQLCDPTVDVFPHFAVDGLDGHLFHAVRYGEPWNGWATPVVDQATCRALLSAVGALHQWQGAVVSLGDGTVTRPDCQGCYDLGEWGWTFITTIHWR